MSKFRTKVNSSQFSQHKNKKKSPSTFNNHFEEFDLKPWQIKIDTDDQENIFEF